MNKPARFSRWRLALAVWVGLLVVVGLAVSLLSKGADRRTAAATPQAPRPPEPTRAPAPRRPNLIMVLVDTVRADHLGYQGYHRPTSPRLDAFASRSVAFLNHWAHASRTGPSVASIFTGLHPQSHGVINPLDKWNAKGTLAGSQTTLAEILSANGYTCHAIVTNVNLSPRFGFSQGFQRYEFMPRGAKIEPAKHRIKPPFFFYLHYMQPHSPYNAPPALRKLWVDPGYKGPLTGDHNQLDAILGGKLKIDDADRRHLVALYDQEIRHFDDDFGKLLTSLGAKGMLQNTIVVVLADHGEEMFDHGGVLHGYTLYREQLHVPLIIHDPRHPTPRRVEALSRHVDVLPTLLELLGIKHNAKLQGRSLVPLLRGQPGAPDDATIPVLAQTQLKAVKTVQLRSLMLGGWTLIEHQIPANVRELYNVAEDPTEQNNLLEAKPERAREMERAMRELLRRLPKAGRSTVQLTDQERKQLRSLGYIK